MAVALDGTTSDSSIFWAYTFDRALVSPSGRFHVLFTATATKAVVRDTEVRDLRELNRSYYCAHTYEYPIAVGLLPDGTEAIFHCPAGYNRLSIERADDGETLTSASEQASDVFHSRLALSPSGRYLLSAGWIWHPLGVAMVYDVAQALREPRHPDGDGLLPWEAIDAEVEAACWLDDDRLLVGTNPESERITDVAGGLAAGELGVWSVADQAWVSRYTFSGHTGTLHRFGEFALALYGHPRVLDVETGVIVDEWPDIKTGQQDSSIIGLKPQGIPAVAVDPSSARLAVHQGDEIVVVEI